MSSFALKIFALILMFIDHTANFIPGMPFYFHWIGRLSAPIFAFLAAWSLEYTRNKEKYLIRLYFAGLIMSVIQCLIQIENNFFRSLFSMCMIMYLIDAYHNNKRNFRKMLLIYSLWQFLTISICILLINRVYFSEELGAYFFPALFGNLFYIEGGLVFILLGVLFYMTKSNKAALIIGYSMFCFIYFIFTTTKIIPLVISKLGIWGFSIFADSIEYLLNTIVRLSPMQVGGSLLYQNFQWMMIFTLPFLLFYNRKKGRDIKYFFYIFYPVHIIALYYLGNILCQ